MKLSPTMRRTLLSLAAIALLAVGGLVALSLAGRPNQPLAASPPPPALPADASSAAEAESLQTLVTSDSFLAPAGTTSLETLPLDLPLYEAPGVTADRLAGYQRKDGDAGEQVGIYSFQGADLQAVQTFYNDHAHRLGFTPQPGTDQAPGNRIYSRDHQLLLVRVRQAGQSVRLTILLRYTERR